MSEINLLCRQSALAADERYDGEAHYKSWDGLGDQFAALNGMKRSLSSFTAEELAHRRRSGRKGPIWPGADHVNYFRQGGYPVAMTAEQYEPGQLAQLVDFVTDHGLALQMPPNPWASLYFPPYTTFAVVTRPGFLVRWLPDQLAYRDLPPRAKGRRAERYPPYDV